MSWFIYIRNSYLSNLQCELNCGIIRFSNAIPYISSKWNGMGIVVLILEQLSNNIYLQLKGFLFLIFLLDGKMGQTFTKILTVCTYRKIICPKVHYQTAFGSKVVRVMSIKSINL